MLKRLHELAAGDKDFAFETTLASRSYVRRLKHLQEARGYTVSLVYLWLSDADLAVSRVGERVRVGGHDVPEAVIRRRYMKGLRNFFEFYQTLADSWAVYDCSDVSKLLLIASKDGARGIQVFEVKRWRMIEATALK